MVGVASCVASAGLTSPMSVVAISAGASAITGGLGLGLFSRENGLQHATKNLIDASESNIAQENDSLASVQL